MAETTTPYSAAKRLINAANIPDWVNDYDAARLAVYDLYEDIYWSEPQTFKIVQRGNEENPIYIPSGRIIVNTMDRYTGRDWTPILDPAFGSENEQKAALLAFTDLFKRERLGSAYESNKLSGLMRGDWFWYITASPTKAAGTRLNVKVIDPRQVFPINPDEKDVDKILGYDLVEQIVVGDTVYINRVRYLKPEHEDHPAFGSPDAPISFQEDIIEMENWENSDELKIFQTITPPTLMPPEIKKLPLYHIKNLEEPGNPFGSSEMRGLERVMAAVNQSITDEELTLAMHGLGMYKSNKGQPRAADGTPTQWILGPGRVVHDETFERVNGVTSVTPFQDHIKYMEDRMHEVHGVSDVARGKVDVTVAESGVALALRMGPILDASRKKDQGIQEVMDNMLFDLRDWFKAYEGLDFTNVRLVSRFGPKLPTNVQERFNMLLSMVSNDPPLITMGYFREAVRELGVDIPETETAAAIADERAAFQLLLDPYAARLDEEEGGDQGDQPPADDTAQE